MCRRRRGPLHSGRVVSRWLGRPEQLAAAEGYVWDSGKVASIESLNIKFGGSELLFSAAMCLPRDGLRSKWSAISLEQNRSVVDGATQPKRLEGELDRHERAGRES